MEEVPCPLWMDGAIKKAIAPESVKRCQMISEFIYDLSNPNPEFVVDDSLPLLERNPVTFWRGLAIVEIIIIFALFYLTTR